MKLGIMQPYFLPYIGYFQLISSVDLFILYDNIKYTKKGWINRNRMLVNGSDSIFSLPLRRDSDYLNVIDRKISEDFNRSKLLNQFKGAYSRAPYFEETFTLLEKIVKYKEDNLFHYIRNSLETTCKHLGIDTTLRASSALDINHDLKNQEKVISLCKAVRADSYINLSGGIELYSIEKFRQNNIDLRFIKTKEFEYKQFGEPFVPSLSIVDMLMFNSIESVEKHINFGYKIIQDVSLEKARQDI